MRIALLFLVILSISCAQKQKKSTSFSKVDITVLYQDSLSIRAIEIMDGSLAFAANKGVFGIVDMNTGQVRSGVKTFDSILPDFRAIAHTASDFFMLSAGNPALLYKTGDTGSMELVYTETGADVFYDAMCFWNDEEGIAIG
ncbi:MAG: oxidoreductase, partial [Eudoraea sp.]|nr:oxidoreductase [Eudoraea sp.]